MRLHIGASLTQLSSDKLAALVDTDWIHLGDPPWFPIPGVANGAHSPDGSFDDLVRGRIDARTTYLPFYYKKGDRLPFDDGVFSFVFSEHFFEHLFLDEACELFKECARVMATGACMRVVVPDADLRTYEPLEPAGFTTGDPRWIHPDKHKSRWSIYSLSYVLEEIGLVTRGVVFCDKFGTYHQGDPPQDPSFYKDCHDMRFIDDTSYILRFQNSLVVDAVEAFGARLSLAARQAQSPGVSR